MASKTMPCTAAVTPLTATPTSPPPATVPRTSTRPEGTAAPAAGSGMARVRAADGTVSPRPRLVEGDGRGRRLHGERAAGRSRVLVAGQVSRLHLEGVGARS